jgi:rhodanese-related sulfurtransferase
MTASLTDTTTENEELEGVYDYSAAQEAEDLNDSGISSDSAFSNCSENIYVSTTNQHHGPTNFAALLAKESSPDLPSECYKDLDKQEKSATDSLSWAEPRKSSLIGLSSSQPTELPSSLSRKTNIIHESPISRKTSRTENNKLGRKRSIRCVNKNLDVENPPSKRLRPSSFQRAFSTSDLEIQRNYDSSSPPEATTTKYSLKIVSRLRSTDIAFGRIDSKYLAELIEKMGEEFYKKYVLIDCRYPFEYDGGHIKGAINLYDPELLRSTFYPTMESHQPSPIHLKRPIFYCEYSSVRGPNMANALRELDRHLNHDRYPYVDYDQIYVLSEGYRHFYHNTDAETHCEPPSYISMKSKMHIKELQKYSFHQKTVGLPPRSRSALFVRTKSAPVASCLCRATATCTCKSLPKRYS